MNIPRRLPLFFLLAAIAACATAPLSAAQLEVLEVRSAKLKNNPLGDPSVRRVAMLVPDATKRDAPLPLVIYLPGWGGSSEDFIAQGGGWLARSVDAMASAGLALRRIGDEHRDTTDGRIAERIAFQFRAADFEHFELRR